MRKINVIFSLYSLTACIIIIERLSPTTRIILSPYHFIRLHELIQTTLFLSITIILSFFMVQAILNNFKTLQGKENIFLLVLFIVGIYLYGAGEGWHEVASFTLNSYCNLHHIKGNLCGGLYINDFYTGNLLFFIGGVFINMSIMALAAKYPMRPFSRKDMIILIINSIIYAFTWFAYAAFDTVMVGLFFSALLMLLSLAFLLKTKFQWKIYPYITYSFIAYSLATIGTILVKLR